MQAIDGGRRSLNNRRLGKACAGGCCGLLRSLGGSHELLYHPARLLPARRGRHSRSSGVANRHKVWQTSANLRVMETMTDEARATIARGWAESGLTQDEYAAQVGVAPRTLRLWLARYASRQPPLVQARAVIADAVERLQALLVAVDAELGCPEPTDPSYPSGQASRAATAQERVLAERSSGGGLTDADRHGGTACDVGMEADTTRHADLDSLVAGVQAALAKSQMTAKPPAPARAAAPATAATEGVPPLVEHQVERHCGLAPPTAAARTAPVSPEVEPLASGPKVVDADGPEDVHQVDAVREAAGPHVAASACHVALQVVDAGPVPVVARALAAEGGHEPAAAPCRRPAQSATGQDQSASQGKNDTPRVLDLEELRKRARQLRSARAAAGAPSSSSFDWGA